MAESFCSLKFVSLFEFRWLSWGGLLGVVSVWGGVGGCLVEAMTEFVVAEMGIFDGGVEFLVAMVAGESDLLTDPCLRKQCKINW